MRKWGLNRSIGEGSAEGEILLEMHIPAREETRSSPLDSRSPKPESFEFPKLLPKNNVPVYDAFVNTPMPTLFDNAQIERVIVCGAIAD